MFFLLPLLPALGATIGATEIAGGIAAAVGIGAGIKAAIDCKEARGISESAREKYDGECDRLRAEAKRTQKKAEEFGRMKKKIYSGILKETLALVRDDGTMSVGANRNACVARILEKDIGAFERRFDGSTVPFPSLVAASGIEPVMGGIMQNIGVFGTGAASLSAVPFLLPTVLGIAMKGSRMLVEAERFAGTVDVECGKIAVRMELCRALRKRILEGMKVVGYLSEKLSDYKNRLSEARSAQTKLSDEEADALFDRTVTLAVALKKAMEAEICKTDGTLLESTGRKFKKLLEEEW